MNQIAAKRSHLILSFCCRARSAGVATCAPVSLCFLMMTENTPALNALTAMPATAANSGTDEM